MSAFMDRLCLKDVSEGMTDMEHILSDKTIMKVQMNAKRIIWKRISK